MFAFNILDDAGNARLDLCDECLKTVVVTNEDTMVYDVLNTYYCESNTIMEIYCMSYLDNPRFGYGAYKSPFTLVKL